MLDQYFGGRADAGTDQRLLIRRSATQLRSTLGWRAAGEPRPSLAATRLRARPGHPRPGRHQRSGGVAVNARRCRPRRADEHSANAASPSDTAGRHSARLSAKSPSTPAAAAPARLSPAANRSQDRGVEAARSSAGGAGWSRWRLARPPSARGNVGRVARVAQPPTEPSAIRTNRWSVPWTYSLSGARSPRSPGCASAVGLGGRQPSSRRSRVWIALPDEPLSAACWRFGVPALAPAYPLACRPGRSRSRRRRSWRAVPRSGSGRGCRPGRILLDGRADHPGRHTIRHAPRTTRRTQQRQSPGA